MTEAHRYAHLNDDEFHKAVRLWGFGQDTYAIASALGRHESVIANAILSIRECSQILRAEAAE